MTSTDTRSRITSGPIAPTLLSLSAPMLIGILSMMAFNLVDAFFIGKLGTAQLAAITLTFPVVMVVATFTIGLGVGAMAVISRGIGEGDQTKIRRLATDALSLTVMCVAVLTIAGLMTVEPLFRALGASGETLPFVKQYMYVWYLGMAFFVIPMVGSNILRATGDTLTPSMIMLGGMALNAVLDPIFIFGWGPVPRLELTGAAIASVVSRGFTLILALWVLHFRENLIARIWPGWTVLVKSWRSILSIGLPVAVSNAIVPVALGVITRIVAGAGSEAVAGFGVATRIEAFAFTLIIALSTGISPFVGQNFGAGRMDRIRTGFVFAKYFSLTWGMVLFVALMTFGEPLARLFDRNGLVVEAASLYLWLVPVSLGLRGIHQVMWTGLNVLGRPYDALVLEGLLAFGLWVPLSVVGSHLAGLPGLFLGLSLANIVGGIAASWWGGRVVGRMRAAGPEIRGDSLNGKE